MRKFIILIIILCTVSVSYAQVNMLTNRSIYDYYDQNKVIQIIGTNYLITNFYKFVVMPPVGVDYNTGYLPPFPGTYLPPPPPVIAQTNYIAVLPGRTNNFFAYIYNVGSIDENNGIDLSASAVPGTTINFTPATILAISSGGSDSYSIGITVDTNIISVGSNFTFDVTNRGQTYAYEYIVRYTAIVSKVVVIEGRDGIHMTTTFGDSTGTIPVGDLGNLDVKIYVEIPGVDQGDIRIYYDVNGSTPLSSSNLSPVNNPPDGTVNNPRFVLMKKLTPSDPNYAEVIKGKNPDEIWVGTIYAADPEVEPGNMVNFVISINGAVEDNAGQPWQYMVKEYKVQEEESATTISLNTKFSPDDPEKKQFHLIFKLNRRCFVNVSVYNVRGERVTVLQNGIMDIGKQFVRWSGRNDSGKPVSMGLYLVVLHTAEFGDIRKVLIIKR